MNRQPETGRPGDAFSDRAALQHQAYADDRKLAARQAIYQYSERPTPSGRGRVLDAVSLRGDERVVDVGCGNGNDLRDLKRSRFGGKLLGLDLSTGMLATVAPLDVPVVNADVACLPLRDGVADVALAMHMLYHCPDLPAAIAELRRVVRPGGVLLASTNSLGHLRQIGDALMTALVDAGGTAGVEWGAGPARFSLDHGGDLLVGAFPFIEVRRTDDRLLVTNVDPVVAYVESLRDLFDHEIAGVWEAAVSLLRERVADEIHRVGAFKVSTSQGIFVCR